MWFDWIIIGCFLCLLLSTKRNSFKLKRTFDGCKADVAIKPKNISEDKWLGIQMKSTLNKVFKKNNVLV